MTLTKVSKKNNLTNIDIIPIKRYFEESSSIPKPI